MKKLIFTLVTVFTITFANSQSREKGTFELVPQIGYSSANYYGADIGSVNSPISAFTFGVGADYFFNNRWSIHSGLMNQTMGTQFTGNKDELKYLTLPINANWHFGSTRKWNLNFGPSVGFLLSAKSNGVDYKDAVNTTQIGLNYGIGYKIEVSEKISILIDFQGMTGLTEVPNESVYSFKNAYSAFNVGGVFKL